jgi:hypothetical protein
MRTRTHSVCLKSSIALAIASGFGFASFAYAAPASTSAYYTDLQSSHVEDATSKGIGQVNMITCIMSAMKPDALVNQGSYIALVDENKCDANSRSSTSNSSGGDGAQAASYTTTTVNSTRASNSDPMLVKVWLDEENDGQPSTIFVHITATEAPSAGNPYGQFRLDFCGKGGGMSNCMMQGYLQGADGALSYFQNEQRGSGASTVALRLSSIGTTSGSGKLDMQESDGTTTVAQNYLFAYDQSHFLRGDQCFSRDASDSGTGLSVWRYGLYDAVTGARVTRNSGFPIDYTASGVTYHGYLGYWGLSLPAAAQATLSNGSVVQKVDYSSGNSPTPVNYTVTVAGGKLTKYTKHSRKLNTLDQIKFDAFVNNATGFFTGAQSNTQYEMYWDNAQQLFVVTGQMDCSGSNGCQLHDLDTPKTVAASFWQTQGGIQGWSQSLGGDLYIDLRNISGALDSTVVNALYHSQDLVYPSQLPAQLYCVNNCPTAATLTSYLGSNSGSSPYAAATFNSWQPTSSYVTYGSDAANAVITSGGQAVVYTNKDAYQQHPQYQSGVRSGRLFTQLADALCGTNNGVSVYCDYKVNDADVYYMWETGPNNWNQFAAVKDSSGSFLQFDAPLQLNYHVPTGVQYGQYASKSIVLQYGGFGDLWGIPGQCVSALTNQPVSCDQDNARYVPEFVIPYDATLGLASDGTNSYLVKWLEREIRFARKDVSACSNLTLPSNVTLPSAANLNDPSNANSSDYIGVKPTVTTAPRVIQGEVKY